jgi:integrase
VSWWRFDELRGDEALAVFGSARRALQTAVDLQTRFAGVAAGDPLLPLTLGIGVDAEVDDPARHISPLRPHDLCHTFAFHLATVTGADAYELERRLGNRSQRYTNPPGDIAASYVEEF